MIANLSRSLLPRAFAVFASAAALSAADAGPAVAEPAWIGSVGRVNITGYHLRSWCTGTLVAPDLVLTARHCLWANAKGLLPRPASVHFVIGNGSGRTIAHARAKGYIAPSGPLATDEEAGERPPTSRDIVLIELSEPLQAPTLKLDTEASKEGDDLLIAGFFRTRQHRLTIVEGCSLEVAEKARWQIDCLMEQGAAGGPVLRIVNDKVSVVGVLAAIHDRGGSLAVPVEVIAEEFRKTTSTAPAQATPQTTTEAPPTADAAAQPATATQAPPQGETAVQTQGGAPQEPQPPAATQPPALPRPGTLMPSRPESGTSFWQRLLPSGR